MRDTKILSKAINLTLFLIGTIIFYSISNPKNSEYTLPMILSLNISLLVSLLYSLFNSKFDPYLKKNPFLTLYTPENSEFQKFSLSKLGLASLLIFTFLSSTILSFSQTSWSCFFFFASPPSIYLIHLLEFSLQPNPIRLFYFVTPLLLILGLLILFFSETPLEDFSKIKIILGFLTTFGIILTGVLYHLVLNCKTSKILASLTTFVLFIILAVGFANGSEKNDKETVNLCLFFAVGVPMVLIISSVYIRYDISAELKNSIFLVLWTCFYVPCMALVSFKQLSGEQDHLSDVVNFSFLAFAGFSLVFETLTRILRSDRREMKMVLVLCLVVLPFSIAAGFIGVHEFPKGCTIILVVLGFIGVAFLLILVLIKFIFESFMMLRMDFSSQVEKILWFDDKIFLIFSVIWKLLYFFSMTFLTRRIYLFDFEGLDFELWLVSQGLIIVVLAAGHSILLENINFFIMEIGHVYPSVRKHAIINQIIPSMLQENSETLLRNIQIGIVIFFNLCEITSFACFAVSKAIYFIVIFNIITVFLFLLGLEAKFKTWNHGSKISSEFLVFIWSCIYVPFVCGPSVILKTSHGDSFDNTSSLMIFFIILCFCLQLGLISGEIYEKLSSSKYVKMISYLEQKKYSINSRNFFIEDFINGNRRLLENIKDIENYEKRHSSSVCNICINNKIHEVSNNHYDYNHSELLRILLLKQKISDSDSEDSLNEDEAGPNQEEKKDNERLIITRETMNSYRNLFRVPEGQTQVKNADFNNAVFNVYREQMTNLGKNKNDLSLIFLQVTHNVGRRVQVQLNTNFIKRILRGLSILIYQSNNEETMARVQKELLERRNRIEYEENIEDQPEEHQIIHSSNILISISKIYLRVNIETKNLIDLLVPYYLMKVQQELLEEEERVALDIIKNEVLNLPSDSIDSSFQVIQLLFFASIFNMYSLSSVALTREISWAGSKISLSSGVVPSESSWTVSMILTFTLIFLFFLSTLVLFLMIKKNKTNETIRKWGKSLMIVIASGMLVEILIFLLSNLICEETEGNSHMQNNEEIECFGSNHIGIIIVSIISFIIYFLLVQVFYPSFYKLCENSEHYFNIEIYSKMIYSAIASCISKELLGFKLFLSLVLALILTVHSVYRINSGKCVISKFKKDLIEYLIVIWIYFWALLVYYEVIENSAFAILIVTIILYSAYAQIKYIINLLKNIKICCVFIVNRLRCCRRRTEQVQNLPEECNPINPNNQTNLSIRT